MNSTIRFLPVIALALAFACGGDSDKSNTTAGDPSPDEGLVKEVIQSGGYTYLRTVRLGKEVWVQAPQTRVAEGDRIVLPEGTPQHDYMVESLGRKFDMIYLVSGIQVEGARGMEAAAPVDPHGAGMPEGHPALPEGHPQTGPAPGGAMGGMEGNPNKSRPPVADVDLTGIAKADNGNTIAEIYAARNDLRDKEVVVRGRVVKVTPQVMNRTWVHIRDGSGTDGTNDLTLTIQGQVAVGDMVLAKGKLSVDRDFGFGYQYAVIVEDAEVTVEK